MAEGVKVNVYVPFWVPTGVPGPVEEPPLAHPVIPQTVRTRTRIPAVYASWREVKAPRDFNRYIAASIARERLATISTI